jgi:hypothetical protein
MNHTLFTATLLAGGVALAATSGASRSVPPPSATERPGIETAVNHYIQAGNTSSSSELREAFHPATMMFYVKDGVLTGVSQPEWWARTDANAGKPSTPATSRKITLVDIDPAGSAAVAKIISEYPEHRVEDYMSLLKIDGRWWIVGKIFHRTVPPTALPSPAAVEADRQAIRATLETLHKALGESDAAAVARVTDPRAMAYTMINGRLVGISAAEGEARLAARKAAGEMVPAPRRIVVVDSEGDAAFARLEHDLPSGRWIDYASLLKVGGEWKIVGLLYAKQ